MANFIVTFQIKADDTYQSRYSSFKKKINELTNYKHWDEDNLFLLLRVGLHGPKALL
ncbi:hypothetical protein ACNUI6_00885 [Pseudomonas aeruginosa]|uniref:hypothetical protein n=1 Tax=Pseudomonas aeruginosa TaxID=287 RepID=UPI003AAFEAE2